MAVVSGPGEAWINLLLERAPELRRAGVLSIGCEGYSAVLAPAEPEPDKGDDEDEGAGESDEPTNPWENPASYPTGNVPSVGDVDPADKLPEIPTFPGDR